ncbi:MAG: hypothetical protein KJO07_09990, partial [Deltaproteobacteria bacterium]|nr:hypothetical protein [Deltaproteobacteria bacterium]
KGAFSLGASGNWGSYGLNTEDKILLIGADFNYQKDKEGFLAEFVYQRLDIPDDVAMEDIPFGTDGDALVRYGISLQGFYAITDWLRPALMVDLLHEPNVDTLRYGPVLAFYPAPEKSPKSSLRVAFARNVELDGDLPTPDTTWIFQAATAF